MPYEIPPWLVPTQTPGQALVSGVNAGSGIARNMLEARAQQQRQQEQDVMLPLKQALYNNQIKSAALDVQKGLFDQQDYLANKTALGDLSRTAAEISKNAAWDKPEAGVAIWDVAAKTPSVIHTPEFKYYASQIDAAKLAKSTLEQKKLDAAVIKSDADRAAREQIATEKNSSAERMNALTNQTRATHDTLQNAIDVLPKQDLHNFFNQSKSIWSDPTLPYDEKQRRTDAILQDLRSRTKSAGGAAPTNQSPVINPEDKVAYDAAQTKLSKLRKNRADLQISTATDQSDFHVPLLGSSRAEKMKEIDNQIQSLNKLAQSYLNSPMSKPDAAQSSEVRRVLEGGRVGIFDANTKKFLRYAD